MKRQALSVLLILLVGFGSLLQLSSFVHSNKEYLPENFIRLIPPPPEALAADFGSPIDTLDIGLFAYYEAADWDLNDVIPAFHNYTQYTNYVDGYVRVWIDVTGTSFVGTMTHDPANDLYAYIDVSVRVRRDGWILAWLDDDQNKAFICHWGADMVTTWNENVEDYGTCLGRAVYRVYHNAGVSWIGYDAIYYYDYEVPDATRLSVFGIDGDDTSSESFYFIIPSGVTIEACHLAGGGANAVTNYIELDSVKKFDYSSQPFGWYSVDITGSVTNDFKHDVTCVHGSSHTAVMVILWTS